PVQGAASIVDPDGRTDVYWDHFSEDVTGSSLYAWAKQAFGTIATEKDSVYTFSEVRAGDDIDIGHVDGADSYVGKENRLYRTTTIGGTPYGATVDEETTPSTTIDFIINTDADWAGKTPPDGTPQIWLTTNGYITATELAGDMLVGHINSTGADVTLYAGGRIIDADTDVGAAATVDVSGVNIYLYSGVNVGETPQTAGGIGAPNDFLEINVDRTNAATPGLLYAYDNNTNAPTHGGIFIDEMSGNLTVAIVHSLENVSLRTVAGSILDGENETVADVLGQAIDLDANGAGASIGAVGNDLDIDSRRGSTQGLSLNVANDDDVALEATANIYLTETDQDLRLLLAHSYTGNIRLTVRESADHDENLQLIDHGSARFAESNSRLPAVQSDAERIIGHGTIFAEGGSITLYVGDDIEFDANADVLAKNAINIYGDANATDGTLSAADPDATFGTNMVLRGRIIANANVTAGNNGVSATGDPAMGTAQPTYTAPGGVITSIFGNDDVDTIQFGDPTGK
ncbi:MAG: hypothetical protein JNJ60_08610, partial [Rhodocyclaceae bacterium]|nr:hypothetical protein [Rhodocyclaceae bacterium]